MLKIAVIAGTTRPHRKSIYAAQLVAEIGRQQPDIEIIFVDPRDFNFPDDGNDAEAKDQRYSKITADADAFFIVTPEYNSGYPGSLKRMLDSEYENYFHKPVAFAGVSDGPWGGVRAIEALVGTARKLGLIMIRFDVQFPLIDQVFDADGKLLNAEYISRVQKVYNELIWMTRKLVTSE